MEIGATGKERRLARELTEEIDRATDFQAEEDSGARPEVAPGGQAEAGRLAGGREGLRDLGRAAIYSGAPAPEGRGAPAGAMSGEEEVKQIVAVENGYVQIGEQGGLVGGENVIGGESAKEVRGRLRDDNEDLQVEEGLNPEQEWQHQILTSGQKKLTDETVKQIDKIIKNEAAKPRQLERERHLGMTAILGTYGRIFGERN